MIMGGQMPKYNYGCNVCNREWAQWHSMDAPSIECPHCFSKNIEKVPSNFITITKAAQEKKAAKENVVDHIEENREILRNMRENAKNEDVLNND